MSPPAPPVPPEAPMSRLADVELHSLFSDHMVIQRGKKIIIWGQAPKGEAIVASFNGENIFGVSGANKTFKLEFPPMKAGGPYTLQVNNTEITDIYIGDVWLAAGQSNMEWPMSMSDSYKTELSAGEYPNVRMVKIPKILSTKEETTTTELDWKIADQNTVGEMSAVAYHFSKEIYDKLDVPIGIINNSWGGTDIEGWMPLFSLEDFPDVYKQAEQFQGSNYTPEEKDKGLKEQWYNERLFTDWGTLNVPGRWEDQGHKGLDGVVWLAKSFTIDELPNQNESASISLAAIDDSDVTFINGVEVGRIENGWNQDRVYNFDPRILRKENFIHVRITDTGSGGGIWGKEDKVFVEIEGKKTPIYGEWKMKIANKTASKNGNPTCRYNAMVHPLKGFGMTGVIWYQGESNAYSPEAAEIYGDQFKSMINAYRKIWNDDLSFLFVQLANYTPTASPGYSHWGEVRAGQDAALQLDKTAMATAIDLGEADDIHPRDKKTVGERLANSALAVEYGFDNDYRNLRYGSHEIIGSKIVINLINQGTGVELRGKVITGFHVLDDTGNYHPVRAEWSNDKLVVDLETYKWKTLYYAWMANPGPIKLYNSYGLPLVPFKIDNSSISH